MASSYLKERNARHRDDRAILWWRRRGRVGTAPNFYYIQPLGERGHFGLEINAPFGLTAEYDDDWIGCYHAIKSELVSINVNANLLAESATP